MYEAQGTALEPSAPLSVLVNRGTASASEVGALLIRVRHCAFAPPPGQALAGRRLRAEEHDGVAQGLHANPWMMPGWMCLFY